MATARSVDFLPEIFQTDANKQFFSATLDQLVQEPQFKKTQGFIGRTVGPGVNPNDKYVIEPTRTRADYQLEPTVVSLDPAATTTVKNAITYPGMNDAIALQGGYENNPDRLYTSEYYSWDPFVDFDTFVNFSQYFWLPHGPDAVDVSVTTVPTTDNFVVNRDNGVYTFSGISGNDPTLNLVRGGSYTFQVAQNNKETVNYRVGNNNNTSYSINYLSNPTLTLSRGNTYVFNLTMTGVHPFWIKTQAVTGTGNAYNSGVSRNGAVTGLITFTVPQDAPDELYYISQNDVSMQGVLKIVNGTPGTGPGFWIQTNPGISGTVPINPNISSRDVFGVTNNGEDLGTVTFNVPSKTAQNFYYNLPDIGNVNLLTTLKFNQINNQPLLPFLQTYGGIDGITYLDGRTLIFTNPVSDPDDGGWLIQQPFDSTPFDPLTQSPAFDGQPGSFDNSIVVPLEDHYQLWRISIVNFDGTDYITLAKFANIANLEKFTINYGEQYSSTQWYKNEAGTFVRVPHLTAVLDTLYYQDGTDPEIFGRINLIEQAENTTLYIDQIIGKKNYTSNNGVTFTNGLKVVFRGLVEPAFYSNNEYYVSGVGSAIELLPVVNFVTPETYVTNENDSGLPVPTDADYLTISRASQDLNAWSRSNRWFHIDVITATAAYNNTAAVLDNNYRAKRPIIQFRQGLRLYNMGTEGKQPVDIIDFQETDAFSNVEGSTGYAVNGYTLMQGSRIIFAADLDPDVRDKVYVVTFIVPDTVSPLIAQPIINLVLANDGLVTADQSVVSFEATLFQSMQQSPGTTYWYNGTSWALAQQKTKVQQAPLFNIYNPNGVSFADQSVYPSSTFVGSKLFSYAVGDTTILDPVLQFPLQYLNINNVGDIVFENNLYKDTFLYVLNNASTTQNISSGSVREYQTRTTYQLLLGWQTAATPSLVKQQFKFTYNTNTLKLDVKVADPVTVPTVSVFVGSVFLESSKYTYTTTSNSTTITLLNTYVPGDIVEVVVLSDQISQVAFYQTPNNLQNNPLNANSPSFTLGTIRTHYESICQNLISLSGPVNGANNTRDLGNIVPYGQVILQQSAPLTLTGYFMRSDKFNVFASLQYNSQEYSKFKAQVLDAVTTQQINFQTPAEILDTAINSVVAGRVDAQPFYWSDMLPHGAVYTSSDYTVSNTTSATFDTVQVYNYRSANYLGLLVYLNDRILTRDLEYVVATNGPRITIIVPLSLGDQVAINEYSTTAGSFVPNTPTKLGLYPAWRPHQIIQRTTEGEWTAILGHDGSVTRAFGDIRDSVLLEFETRIYNNLKLDGNPVPLTVSDVLPGQFRSTGYSLEEINNILAKDFLSWVAWNKLDYRAQDYRANNEFTWNYSGSQNRLNNQNLLGAWRGIYRYFYDTQQPQYTPWEMLGFSIKPDWWENTYGTAPYTADNLVLWDDLQNGYVADPVAPYVRPEFARPGLTSVIPTGSQGELLPPFDSVVGTYSQTQFRKSWAVGDGGPVEAAWWNSSSYPFAVMRLLAVTRPAKFFALFADRDLYRYNAEYDQYLYNDRYRLDANGIEVYGNGVSKASYIDWIVDYNRQTGVDSTKELAADLKALDVRLSYRMASFSDKKYIKLYTEKSSPNSQNTTLLIPDESYNLILYKNQPFDRVSYSSVVVQQVPGGYAVFGYSTAQPYFNIVKSLANGQLRTFTVAGVTVQVPAFYTNTVVQVPYGFVFADLTSVSDFLLCYGYLLELQGLTFTDRANGYLLDWSQMVTEFLYWSQQGWDDNALINLNPLASKLTVTKSQSIVDSVRAQTSDNILLDQDRRELPTKNLNIVRLGNTFSAEPLTEQSLNYIDLRFTSYEHMIILNNKSVFGDLMYDPVTGARQNRLTLIAVSTANWNGSVDTPGFILNQNNVEEWTGLRTYSKGEIVKYKNVYWSALTIVQPSATFETQYWTQSNYTQIQLGLLPNIANKADQLANSYNINTANIELDNDLLSYGLIGFRPRQYMAALNLDDVSQVNIYRQFLGSKGTLLSAELFNQADLGKEAGDYKIYENWAVLRSTYGANANRSFFELRLNRALLSSNPSLVQVVVPQQPSQADQTVLLTDVWRKSYQLTSPNILPTTTTLPTDISLPTAGYVNVDDVDITVFSIDDTASLAANIDSIKVGTSIWVAKINAYDWNIYRAQQVPGQIQHVCDNLNGTSRVIFSQQHGLLTGDTLIIKYFDQEINGVYKVLSVADLVTVNIAFKFRGSRTVADGTGIGFTLKTMRVAQASDVLSLPYANTLQPGATVWVDNNGQGFWEVLQKQNVFSTVASLSPVLLDASEQYGQSIAQAFNRFAALVGSPRYGFGLGTAKGAVYVYVRSGTDQYIPISPLAVGDSILTLDAVGVRGYGNAVDFGYQNWAVAGASASLGPTGSANNGYACVIFRDPYFVPGAIPYTQWQLLTQPGTTTSTTPGAGEFGYAVVMSQDERWMYIGAPGLNQVHAYGRVDWQDQYLNTFADGSTTQFAFNQVIQISAATQIRVTVDGQSQILNKDYTVLQQAGVYQSVVFFTEPAAGLLVSISRINTLQLDSGTYYQVTQSSTSGTGTGAQFTIVRERGYVGQPGSTSGTVGVAFGGSGYSAGNTITIAASKFGGGVDGVNNIVLTVTAVAAGAVSGFTIAYTPPAAVQTLSINEYFATASNIYSFSVKVNDVLQRPNIDYTFNTSTGDITFTVNPAYGAVIVVRAQGYFEYVNSITLAGLSAGDRFGQSISCTTDGRQLIVGTPNSTVNGQSQAGLAYVFDRNVQRFIYNETSTITFTVLGTVTAPVLVMVNNVFLVNQTDSVLGANNTFSVNGNNITIQADLQVGDIIEIETNQFSLIQTIQQHAVADFSNFGTAVDLCNYNCSLYVGEPQSSLQSFKGGIIERFVNQSRVYGIISSTNKNPTLTVGNTLRVNNQDVTVPAASGSTSSLQGLANNINVTVPNVTASVSSQGILTLAVANSDAAPAFNKLQVSTGSIGTAFSDLGFNTNTFAWTQNIFNPYPLDYAAFGSAISINDTATNLVVGAPNGTIYIEIEFDQGTTIFDDNATVFFSLIVQSGAVYTFDYLPSSEASITNPGNFVFGSQIVNSNLDSLSKFGTAVNYNSGVLMVGAPGNDLGDSSSADFGSVSVYENPNRVPSWTVIYQQQPVVDIQSLDSVFLYNRITSATTEFLDFFDPLQGKILGAARENIDYISGVDPASYNIGPANINGATWSLDHEGEVWWDVSTMRFVDPNQESIVYASRRWGQLFPGSAVDVYQWIESSVPPSAYTGPGIPRDTVSYSVNSQLSNAGLITTQFYFWVKGITALNPLSTKTLPPSTVANYIENPRASGIAYLAPINASTVALYNCSDLIAAQDTILHIGFDRELTTDNVHTEYELIAQDRANAFLSDNLYRKLQDSFCGVDTFGNKVPDPNLGPAESYGVQFRPRQSMFTDRFVALQNYLKRANAVMSLYPLSEAGNYPLLNSSEPILPSSENIDGQTVVNWNRAVANLEELGYQNIYDVALGYRYLVASDSNNRGLWTIYEVQNSQTQAGVRVLTLVRVQLYYTPDYWSYVNWYRPGYNSTTKVTAEVPNYATLSTLAVPIGSSVRVTANAQGKFEIYLRTDLGWERVGLQDGTIEFSATLWDYAQGKFGFDVEVFDAQYFDQEPVIETRKIIQAINEEIFVDDLAIQRNKALVLMFNFVLSEFSAPDWLVKTSLIDVEHRIRALIPYQNYVRDNQAFVSDYIQEVKPYHVQVREFNLRYNGFDKFFGDVADFDLPAYYNTGLEIPQYTSPVLLPYNHGTAQVSNFLSDLPASSAVWETWPYSQWFNNYLLDIVSVRMVNNGQGYVQPPTVRIEGDATVAATAVALVNSVGQVVAINITSPGSGYKSTPTIVFEQGNGSGAVAYAVLGNGLVRNIRTTIRYDRCEFQSSVVAWQPSVIYTQGTLARYLDRVWQANSVVPSSAIFDLAYWTEIPASALNGADRTMGYYVPGVNQPGLELPLLIDGIDYPGVQVYGNGFLGNPAFVDAQYQSEFTDVTLGTRPTDINVQGGAFVGPYEGHAPEELVNAAEFDTLDLRVYTRPGADWATGVPGHGFQIGTKRYTIDSAVTLTYSWASVVEHPVEVLVSNQTTGLTLHRGLDYLVDWSAQTITMVSGYANGNIINISIYELGGGSQLYRANYMGADVGSSALIPVNAAEILTLAIFVNGANTATATWTAYIDSENWNLQQSYSLHAVVNHAGAYYRAIRPVPVGTAITNVLYWQLFVPTQQSLVNFGATYGANDGIALVALGHYYVDPQYLVRGRQYTITRVGTTDFTTVGADTNTVGTVFTATNATSGTGQAETVYSWSTPQTQTVTVDSTFLINRTITCSNSLQGTNPANLIVTKNGQRLRPPEGIEWIGDGTTVSFGLPQRGGYSQQIINAATDVTVWVNGILQTQSVGSTVGNYGVTNWNGSNTPGRQVVFAQPPQANAKILISVSTVADYQVNTTVNQIAISAIVNIGNILEVITWNDTSQQNLLTQVFQGPVNTSVIVYEAYDTTVFDLASSPNNNTPGTFDYSVGELLPVNNFDLQRTGLTGNRLWVTLNGLQLFDGEDFVIQGQYLILSSGTISSSQVLVVTQVTTSIVPESAAFRIFQDMRGVQATYRITNATTTTVAQPVAATDDEIFVANVSALTEPNLPLGIFGTVTIDGERIMYRVRDKATNSISNLLRGTAGTGAADHQPGTSVYDIGRGNLLNQEYQDRIVSNSALGDGTTAVFYAPSITASDFADSSIEIQGLEVYVGGMRQYVTFDSQYPWFVSNFDPVAIGFEVPPPAGSEVTILVRRGVTWYAPGVNTASDGVALQETDTVAARFLCDR
jgi:hypothetical protein